MGEKKKKYLERIQKYHDKKKLIRKLEILKSNKNENKLLNTIKIPEKKYSKLKKKNLYEIKSTLINYLNYRIKQLAKEISNFKSYNQTFGYLKSFLSHNLLFVNRKDLQFHSMSIIQ